MRQNTRAAIAVVALVALALLCSGSARAATWTGIFFGHDSLNVKYTMTVINLSTVPLAETESGISFFRNTVFQPGNPPDTTNGLWVSGAEGQYYLTKTTAQIRFVPDNNQTYAFTLDFQDDSATVFKGYANLVDLTVANPWKLDGSMAWNLYSTPAPVALSTGWAIATAVSDRFVVTVFNTTTLDLVVVFSDAKENDSVQHLDYKGTVSPDGPLHFARTH